MLTAREGPKCLHICSIQHISDSFGIVIDKVIDKTERFCYGRDYVKLKAGEGAEIMGHAYTDDLTVL
jgi:hypothetical protein